MKTNLKFYDELSKFEKILYRLHLKKVLKISGKDLRIMCNSQKFMDNNPRSSFKI